MSGLENGKSPPRQSCRIIIVGAGIAGLTTAIGLTKAGHNEVVVLERMPEFPPFSAGLHLPPNGCRALEQLGLLAGTEKHSTELLDITLRTYTDGSVLRSLRLVPDMRDKYDMPYLATHRVTFHKGLEEVARAQGVQIEFGCIVSSIDFKAPSVHLEDDRTFMGDLVIGSDGAISQCRSLLLGRPDPPNHFGHMLFSCEMSQDAIRDHEDLRDLVDSPGVPWWFGPGTLCLASVVKESGTVNLLGSIVEPMTNTIQTHPQVSDMKEINDYHKDWDPKLRKLLDLAPFCLKWTSTTILEVRDWAHPDGKFVLLGDAAHAMTPYLAQGAAQCLEDAVVLSQLLSRVTHREQIPDVTSIYESMRKPRALKLKHRSEEMRDIYCVQNGPKQEERDRQLRDLEPYPGYVIPWLDPEFQRWMYTYDASAEAGAAWKTYQEGKWPGTRGLWKLSKVEYTAW